MHGKVTTWQMTEDERLAYIEKHPIKPKKQRRSSSIDTIDYQWRGKKAATASQISRRQKGE